MKLFSIFLFLIIVANDILSQNQPPVLSNVKAEYEYRDRRLEIHFDVSDAENDSLEIRALLSDNAGESFDADFSTATGDIGTGILPGTGKMIVWTAPNIINFLDHQVKLVVEDGGEIDIQDLVDQVDSSRVRNDLSWLAQERTPTPGPALTHLNAVKDSLEAIFLQSGLQAVRQSKNLGTYTLENIIGRKAGLVNDTLTYLVDAHFDGVGGTDAADDNGSGTVGVIECARILGQYEYENSLRFIGFDQEEAGLEGSIAYVTDGIPANENIQGVLNFEMIGYYDDQPNTQQFPAGFEQLFPSVYNLVSADSFKGNFITSVSNDQSNPLRLAFDSAAARYVPNLRVISFVTPNNGIFTPDLLRSDHAPFWQTNRPALMLTDGAEFRNSNYHTPSDTLGTINFNFLHQVVKAAVATLATLAKPIHADVAIAAFELISGISDVQDRCGLRIQQSEEQVTFSLSQGFCWDQAARIDLIDLQGKMIRSTQLGASQLQANLSLSNLSSGIYLWVMHSPEGTFSEKILVR